MVANKAKQHFKPLSPALREKLAERGLNLPKTGAIVAETMIGMYLNGERGAVVKRLGRKLDTKDDLSFEEGALLLCAAGVEADTIWHQRLQQDNPVLYGKAMARAWQWHRFFADQSFQRSGLKGTLGLARTGGPERLGCRAGRVALVVRG